LIDLKDCPFCGGKAKIISRPVRSSNEQIQPSTPAIVGCKKCWMIARIVGYVSDALEIAIAKWNKRVESCNVVECPLMEKL